MRRELLLPLLPRLVPVRETKTDLRLPYPNLKHRLNKLKRKPKLKSRPRQHPLRRPRRRRKRLRDRSTVDGALASRSRWKPE